MINFGPPLGDAQYPAGAVMPVYPVAPRPVARRAPRWIGGLLATAGLITVVGSFLTWARYVVGGIYRLALSGTDAGNDGWLTAFLGAAMVALGVVIMARQGRLWVGIVGTVVAALTVLIALADLGNVGDAGDALRTMGVGRVDVGPGLVLVLLAAWAALGASIVAIVVREPLGRH